MVCSFLGNPDWWNKGTSNKWLEGKWLTKRK